MYLTYDLFRTAMPGCPEKRAKEYYPYLLASCFEAEINTPARLSAYLAQLGHESCDFRYMEEIASGSAYDTGRLARRLGNTPERDGDGELYKGRGVIMITGHDNYEKAGEDLKLDLLGHPEIAATKEVAFRIAAWYWRIHNLNALADADDFDGITVAINGGYNGKEDRDRRKIVADAAFAAAA